MPNIFFYDLKFFLHLAFLFQAFLFQVKSGESEMYEQRLGRKNIRGQSKHLATWIEKNIHLVLIVTHFTIIEQLSLH